MKVFLQAIYGQLFLNAYIIRRGYQALPSKRLWRTPFILFFGLELLLYFTGYFFYKDLPDSTLHFIMLVCSTWYVASIYVSFGLLFLDLIRLSNRIRPWYPGVIKKNWQNIKLSLFFVFIFLVVGLLIHGYRNAVYPVVRHVNIHIPKVVEVRDSLTIVLMSDLHIGEFVGKKNVQRIVELCNAEQPDMVLIAGDVLDYESRHAEKQHVEDDLQRLNAPLGVYMVLGNHEYRANRFAKLRWLEKTGGILLVDSVAMPDSAFYLIGRDDEINTKRASMEMLMQGLDVTKPLIVIAHEPVSAGEAIDNECDLAVFGHTHNGQYWPFPHLLKIVFEFPYGYFLKGNTHIYVSSGTGFAGVPYRVGTRSEMVVLHISFGCCTTENKD
jgi:predicted MPP superfamily phosphohydrolase